MGAARAADYVAEYAPMAESLEGWRGARKRVRDSIRDEADRRRRFASFDGGGERGDKGGARLGEFAGVCAECAGAAAIQFHEHGGNIAGFGLPNRQRNV